VTANWTYAHSTLRPDQGVTAEERSAEISAHMNEMASKGWELFSAAPIERMTVWSWQATGASSGAFLGFPLVSGKGLIDHHFYWRRPQFPALARHSS